MQHHTQAFSPLRDVEHGSYTLYLTWETRAGSAARLGFEPPPSAAAPPAGAAGGSTSIGAEDEDAAGGMFRGPAEARIFALRLGEKKSVGTAAAQCRHRVRPETKGKHKGRACL